MKDITLLILYKKFFELIIKFQKKNRVQKSLDNIVVLFPTTAGNLGDNAMLNGIMDSIGANVKVTVIAWDSSLRKEFDSFENISIVDFGPYFFAGYRMLFKGFVELLKLFRTASKFILIGADVLDGKYSDRRTIIRLMIVNFASRMRLNSRVVSCSFNKEPTKKSKYFLRNTDQRVVFYPRDELSKNRLAKLIKNPITQSADAAFLMNPAQSGYEEFLSWHSQLSENNQHLIIVNLNALFVNEAFYESHYQTIQNLISISNHKIAFVFIPHDIREENNDYTALNRLCADLIQDFDVDIFIPKIDHLNARYVKAIAAYCDLAITSRMHLGIACLGQGLPVIGIAYQGKFKGLFSKFEIVDLIIPMEQLDAEVLSRKASNVLSNLEEYSNKVKRNLDEIKGLSWNNINGL